jgi:hypothetical protein
MRRDVADGCGADKMWISGEPGRVSSGSGELGANLGEERRALVVDQERSATSSTSFRPKLLRVASYLGWEKAEKRPRLARESCSGAGGRFARRKRWVDTGGRGPVLQRRQSRTCCSSRQRRSWGNVAVRSGSVAPRVFVRRLALGSQHAHVDVTRRRVFAPYAGRNARACAALQRNAASSAWRGPILTKTST